MSPLAVLASFCFRTHFSIMYLTQTQLFKFQEASKRLQKAFLRLPIWFQEGVKTLQSTSKQLQDVAHVCFSNTLLKYLFFKDVFAENPVFNIFGIDLEPIFSFWDTFSRRPRGVLVCLGALLERLGAALGASSTHLWEAHRPFWCILNAVTLLYLQP